MIAQAFIGELHLSENFCFLEHTPLLASDSVAFTVLGDEKTVLFAGRTALIARRTVRLAAKIVLPDGKTVMHSKKTALLATKVDLYDMDAVADFTVALYLDTTAAVAHVRVPSVPAA